MFRTEDLVQESKGKRALHPLQERHTQCDELSSYRSVNLGTDSRPSLLPCLAIMGLQRQPCLAIRGL